MSGVLDLTPTNNGGEVRVNGTTAGTQNQVSIMALSNGGYVVTWVSDDDSGTGIYAQLYDASGNPVGGEFRVNGQTTNNQSEATVAALADGGFVVTWTSQDQDGSGDGVFAQRFDATGTTVGGEFQVNAFTSGNQRKPVVASLADGGFVIAWSSFGQDGSNDGVYLQQFDAAGTAVGGEVRVNTATAFSQNNPSVAGLAEGGYVVTWVSEFQDGDRTGVFAQRFDTDGQAVGSEFQINETTSGSQDRVAVAALEDGGFVVTWTDDELAFGTWQVMARRYDANGVAAGGEFAINTGVSADPSLDDFRASVTGLSDGGFFVTWTSAGQDGDGEGVVGRRFDFNGNAVGSEVIVNETTTGQQRTPESSLAAVTQLENGQVVGVWQGNGTGDADGVFARTFDLPGLTAIEQTDLDLRSFFREFTDVFDDPDNPAEAQIVISVDVGTFQYRTDANSVVSPSASNTTFFSDTVTLSGGSEALLEFVLDTQFSFFNYVFDDDAPPPQATLTIAFTDITNGEAPVTFTETINILAVDDPSTIEFRPRFESGPILVSEAGGGAGDQIDPVIAKLDGGRFVVAWTEGDDGSDQGVSARVFEADGTPVGATFRVNADTPAGQTNPAVAALDGGGFVVTFESRASGSVDTIARIFDADGAAVTGDFRLPVLGAGDGVANFAPVVTRLDGGGFVAIWEEGLAGAGLQGAIYAADGTQVGSEFTITDANLGGSVVPPVVTALDGGGFAVAWDTKNNGPTGLSVDEVDGEVFVRVFDAAGAAVSAEINAATVAATAQQLPGIARLSNGNFVVSWQEHGGIAFGSIPATRTDDAGAEGVRAQIFGADGSKVGGEFLVNTTTDFGQFLPSVTALDSGFVIVWVDVSTFPQRISAQIFANDGTPVGGEFVVAQNQLQLTAPEVITLEGGGFAVQWAADENQNSQSAVFSRAFADDGTPLGATGQLNGAVTTNPAFLGAVALDDGAYALAWAEQGNGADIAARVIAPPQTIAEEDTPFDLKGRIAVDDRDLPAIVSTVLSVTNGVLDVTAGTSGANVSGSGTATVTITGTLAEVQALLQTDATSTVTYTATGDTPPASDDLTVTFTDIINSGTPTVLTQPITIQAVNDAPSGADATITIDEDVPYTFAAADFGHSDPEGDALAAVRIETLPLAGTLTLGGVAVTAGQEIALADIGNLVFTPGADENGTGYASFTFSVSDGTDFAAAPNTITVDVTPVGDARGDIASVNADSTVVIDIRSNDTDTAPLATLLINGEPLAAGESTTLASGAIVTLNPDGTVTYDPNGSYDALVSAATAVATGAVNTNDLDVFTYTLEDDESAVVLVSIDGVDGPGDRIEGSGAGNTLTGTAAGDLFVLDQGGSDTVSGGDGSDGFFFGDEFDAGDVIDGGAGEDDQVGVQGSVNVTMLATTLTDVETIVLLTGTDARFDDSPPGTTNATFVMHDGNVAAGEILTINANRLQAGESMTVDGSAETDGSFLFYGGEGTDTLTGGQQSDGFFFGEGRFGPDDIVDGQGGADDQIGFKGDYSGLNRIEFGSGQLIDIETIVLLTNNDTRFGGAGSGTPYNYEVIMGDDNVASGATMTINANRLASDESLDFNGSFETDGQFRIFSGRGDDLLIGSSNNDTISGGRGADTMFGGGGDDVFVFNRIEDSPAGGTLDVIVDFNSGDTIDLSAIDADTTTGGNQAFTFIDDADFSNTAGELRATNESGSRWRIEADVDGDGVADFALTVLTAGLTDFQASDFVL